MLNSSKLSKIINELIEFVNLHYSVGDVNVTPETNLIVSGVIDSIQVIELIVYIEKKYNIEFTEDDLLDSEFASIAGLTELILSK
ncbi:acyl carrier protein [Candidatus Thioglobus autotrophicus]|jgi:acyl carrier protein|uniref:acyl carrier protein n=1 Tax=Candidatus Thioglobus autotrophicus TaxID=1705394 RepID=UPI0006B56705|nr:acyl carrier protein [Candidatus Thioglobus autotrophicus]